MRLTFSNLAIKLIISLTLAVFCQSLFAIEWPQRGTLKDTVKTEFGAPLDISAAVGEPPMSHWVYQGFTVIFKYDHVVHAFSRNNSVETLSRDHTVSASLNLANNSENASPAGLSRQT